MFIAGAFLVFDHNVVLQHGEFPAEKLVCI
jgi:hypothetical protein